MIKENPIKATVAVVTLVTMITAGIITIDNRYAKAEDLRDQHIQTTTEIRYAIDQLRRKGLDDKVFELELVQEKDRTQAQTAILERFKRDMRNIDSKWVYPTK